jgi:hypothetical protein
VAQTIHVSKCKNDKIINKYYMPPPTPKMSQSAKLFGQIVATPSDEEFSRPVSMGRTSGSTLTPALGRLRQEDHEFKVRLLRPCLNNKKAPMTMDNTFESWLLPQIQQPCPR